MVTVLLILPRSGLQLRLSHGQKITATGMSDTAASDDSLKTNFDPDMVIDFLRTMIALRRKG